MYIITFHANVMSLTRSVLIRAILTRIFHIRAIFMTLKYETSKQKQLERQAAEDDANNRIMLNIPLPSPIYIL